MDGDALHNGAESAVLPFGVEEVKFAKFYEWKFLFYFVFKKGAISRTL